MDALCIAGGLSVDDRDLDESRRHIIGRCFFSGASCSGGVLECAGRSSRNFGDHFFSVCGDSWDDRIDNPKRIGGCDDCLGARSFVCIESNVGAVSPLKMQMDRTRIFWLIGVYVLLIPVVTALQCAVLLWHDPVNTAWMRMRVREARAEHKQLEIQHHWVDKQIVPTAMKQAVVAAEDERFFTHHGFEWGAIKNAFEQNEKKGKVKRGGSTITQQLSKNLFLSPSRSYWRKAREALITVFIELFLSKERVLEIYLNSIEFGPGIFGIEAAAEYHFHIPAKRLTISQCCKLAAIIPSPRRYRVSGNYVIRRAATLERIISGQPAEAPENSSEQTPDTSRTQENLNR